jgi:ArsR family transcriptional regulator, lead/cadmium/zinc/bismuth-responsive transcriptional repressor
MGKQPSAGNPHNHAPRSWLKLPDASELEEASAMFRALGDPARLRLLARLAGSEVCVTKLADLEDEKLTTVSARLRTLYEARLVKRRREAKHVYYALSDTHVLQLVQSAMQHAAE